MLMSEFVERTNYRPSCEEYAIIEEAYIDFEGDKDAFCKWWVKANKDGYWKREYELRKALNSQYECSEARIIELEEALEDRNEAIQQLLDERFERNKERKIKESLLQEKERLITEMSSTVDAYNRLMDALHLVKDFLD